MWLIHGALRRPFTVLVAVIGVALCSILAITRMPRDIFPSLDLPVIYVAQPYGGMGPAQMEGYLTYYYEYHFLYISGTRERRVEIRSRLRADQAFFRARHGHDSGARRRPSPTSNRAHAYMPAGTVPPFIMRFDAGSVPVGYLVFSSETTRRR